MAGGNCFLLNKEHLQDFLDSLSAKMDLYAPLKEGSDFNFRKTEKKQKIDLRGYLNTEFPPKRMLLPEGETLLEYDGKKVREKFQKKRSALFGVRPCDINALVILDRVMFGHGIFERHYQKRRNNTLIIGMRCNEAGENCFCGSMEDPAPGEGYDMMLTDHGSHYHVEAATKEARKLVSGNRRLFRHTKEKARPPKLKFRKTMNTENLSHIMEDSWNSRVWNDVAKRCLSCASCTAVCPTCYCFSTVHDSDLANTSSGKVTRENDYCMLPRFTRVAGGHVFRESRKERVKQFFYHKLLYGKNNEGALHCVGCGRCITECMAKIDITEEVNKLREEHES